MLTERVKWYCITSAAVFWVLTVYLHFIYDFSHFNSLRLDAVLGYARFVAGAATLIFGTLIPLRNRFVNFNPEWFAAISAGLFIIISTYMQIKLGFVIAWIGSVLYLCELALAVLTLVLGLLSFPRWQSIFALVIWLYSFYRFSQPPFAI
jgi:hypothetical protein